MADGELAFLDAPLPPDSILRALPRGDPSSAPEAVDLVSLQDSLLKALGRSADIVEQAKIILDNTNAQNTDLEKAVAASDGINKNPPQGRRQGVGRRKSRFSMMPAFSQGVTNFNMKLDIENLADPEEYFAAVEKMENATREINKLTGQTSPNAEGKVQFARTRERRPGLTGRRASYRHLGPVTDLMPLSGGNKMSISNPATINEVENGNSENHNTLPGTSPGQTAISGSGIKESRDRKLLDSLLSSFQGLDDEDRVALLQDKLQLKQIDVKKIHLPDTPHKLSSQQDIENTIDDIIQEADVGESQIIRTKETSTRSPLSAISLLENSTKKARLSRTLSSLRQSPFAAMTLLQKKASLEDSPMPAAYSLTPTDEETRSGTSSGKDASSRKEASGRPSDQGGFISTQFELDDDVIVEPTNLQNLVSNKHETPIQNEKDVTSFLSHPNDKNINNPPPQESCNDSGALSPLLNGTVQFNQQVVLDGAITHGPPNGNSLPNENVDAMLLEGSAFEPAEDNVEALSFETQDENVNVQVSTPQDMNADMNQHPEFDRPDDHDQNTIALTHQRKDSETFEDQPSIHASTDQQFEQPSPSNEAEESEEPQVASRVLVKKRASKTHARKWTREVFRRKSLAGAGTSWKDGVRRSTRHRIRPLEHWRGERLLYGRIHESLATVIGVKCSSPGSTTLKVKSYVPEKYKDLVELVALH